MAVGRRTLAIALATAAVAAGGGGAFAAAHGSSAPPASKTPHAAKTARTKGPANVRPAQAGPQGEHHCPNAGRAVTGADV